MKAGISNTASFIALSNSAGSTGSSAGTPSTILNSPAVSIYNTDFLGKKCSKSQVKALLIFGVSIATAPVPSNCLFLKSKELAVAVIVSTAVTVSVAPVMFSAVGLKSRQSLRGNIPDGLGSSGSIFVALYVGMSS